MLVTITGKVTEELEAMLVVEAGGIGYGIHLSLADRGQLRIGETVKLYLYDHVKEDARELFGFVRSEDRALFVELISVSGVGPRTALAILASGGERVRQAIVAGNSEILRSAPGIGKRTAERIIVELKNRLSGSGSALTALADAQSDPVYQALRQLGYSAADVQQIGPQIPADVKGEQERLRYALKVLAK